MVKSTGVELTTREGDWLVFNLQSLEISVTYPVAQYHSRKASIVLSSPEGKVTRIAQPLHAGAGPQPENTITQTEVGDMVQQFYRELEQRLSITEKEKGTW